MDRKGFTLFTALVAFVLIVLSVLLVHGMISAERDRIDLIAGIEEQTTMQTIADMERSDAMQILIYDLRFIMERWLNEQSKSGGIGPICKTEGEKEKVFCSFDELVENFSDTYFGGKGTKDEDATTQMSNWMANSLMNLLPRVKEVGSYVIRIEEDTTENDVTNKLREGLEILITNSALSEEGDFFEVIGCENGDPENCVGTFYLNFRASELTDEEYEKLPQIIIENTATGRTIRQAILPRENFRVYVPIRIFKAIAEARALALEYKKEDGSTWRENYGLLSPRIHNEIEEMRLGVCDPGICNPRTNPYEPPEQKNFDYSCPSSTADKENYKNKIGGGIIIECPASLSNTMTGFCNGAVKYNPSDTDSTGKTLASMVGKRIEYLAEENLSNPKLHPPDDKFVHSEEVILSITYKNNPSKKVIVEKGEYRNEGANKFNYNSNTDPGNGSSPCPMGSSWLDNSSGGFGVFFEEGEMKKIVNTKSLSLIESWIESSPQYTFCTEIEKIDFTITFEETNGNYIVNKKIAPKYSIKIRDIYTPFSMNYKSEIDSSTCALEENPADNPIFWSNGDRQWTCKSTGSVESSEFPSPTLEYACLVPD